MAFQKKNQEVAIALRLGCGVRTVRKWRARFRAAPQLESLYEGERSGRPPKVDITTRCDLVGLAGALVALRQELT